MTEKKRNKNDILRAARFRPAAFYDIGNFLPSVIKPSGRMRACAKKKYAAGGRARRECAKAYSLFCGVSLSDCMTKKVVISY